VLASAQALKGKRTWPARVLYNHLAYGDETISGLIIHRRLVLTMIVTNVVIRPRRGVLAVMERYMHNLP
jgi:hypothetical protein